MRTLVLRWTATCLAAGLSAAPAYADIVNDDDDGEYDEDDEDKDGCSAAPMPPTSALGFGLGLTLRAVAHRRQP